MNFVIPIFWSKRFYLIQFLIYNTVYTKIIQDLLRGVKKAMNVCFPSQVPLSLTTKCSSLTPRCFQLTFHSADLCFTVILRFHLPLFLRFAVTWTKRRYKHQHEEMSINRFDTVPSSAHNRRRRWTGIIGRSRPKDSHKGLTVATSVARVVAELQLRGNRWTLECTFDNCINRRSQWTSKWREGINRNRWSCRNFLFSNVQFVVSTFFPYFSLT